MFSDPAALSRFDQQAAVKTRPVQHLESFYFKTLGCWLAVCEYVWGEDWQQTDLEGI